MTQQAFKVTPVGYYQRILARNERPHDASGLIEFNIYNTRIGYAERFTLQVQQDSTIDIATSYDRDEAELEVDTLEYVIGMRKRLHEWYRAWWKQEFKEEYRG